jgi:hypothetical protein
LVLFGADRAAGMGLAVLKLVFDQLAYETIMHDLLIALPHPSVPTSRPEWPIQHGLEKLSSEQFLPSLWYYCGETWEGDDGSGCCGCCCNGR